MRVLVTGASGFAGDWLSHACAEAGEEVLGISRSGSGSGSVSGVAVDLCDAGTVRSLVARFAPDVVYHLAAQSSVGRSWSDPAATVAANVGGAASLLEALRLEAPTARVVWVSSSEVYGTVSDPPIGETVVPVPESPYAVSKLAAEGLAEVYRRAHGLPIVIARPFSHSGPGQLPSFLLSNIASQAVRARRAGSASLTVRTGNPDVRRDVTDVRDVIRAYRLLAAAPSPHGVFNVCTGVTRSTAEQVAALAEAVAPGLRVVHEVDPALVRGSEVMELRGDPSRLRAATGWTPEIPFERTLADTIAFWERSLAAG